jgi:hypothetical protein
LLGLACIHCHSFFEVVQGFSKFAQGRWTFICDLLLLWNWLKQIFLQCIMKAHQSFHITNLVSSMTLLNMPMTSYVWLGGQNLPLKLNMLPLILVASFICYISRIESRRSWAWWLESVGYICGRRITTMFKGCYRSNLWIGNEISSLRTLGCNWGDLPTLLDSSQNKNNIFELLGYFSSAFWAPRFGGLLVFLVVQY